MFYATEIRDYNGQQPTNACNKLPGNRLPTNNCSNCYKNRKYNIISVYKFTKSFLRSENLIYNQASSKN